MELTSLQSKSLLNCWYAANLSCRPAGGHFKEDSTTASRTEDESNYDWTDKIPKSITSSWFRWTSRFGVPHCPLLSHQA